MNVPELYRQLNLARQPRRSLPERGEILGKLLVELKINPREVSSFFDAACKIEIALRLRLIEEKGIKEGSNVAHKPTSTLYVVTRINPYGKVSLAGRAGSVTPTSLEVVN